MLLPVLMRKQSQKTQEVQEQEAFNPIVICAYIAGVATVIIVNKAQKGMKNFWKKVNSGKKKQLQEFEGKKCEKAVFLLERKIYNN